jgi:hypothetical protein
VIAALLVALALAQAGGAPVRPAPGAGDEERPHAKRPPAPEQGEPPPAEDAAVIENLDVLQQLELLESLDLLDAGGDGEAKDGER